MNICIQIYIHFMIIMIIGISGKKGSGKDTAANHLNAVHGYATLSYAEPLKKTCSIVFGIPIDYFNDRNKKEETIEEWKASPRQLMQTVGTDLFRNHFDKDVWIKSLTQRIRQTQNKRIVVSDVRFPNEALHVKNMGGKLIHILRRNLRSDDDHESESNTDELSNMADFIISNDDTINELYETIDNIIKTLHQ